MPPPIPENDPPPHEENSNIVERLAQMVRRIDAAMPPDRRVDRAAEGAAEPAAPINFEAEMGRASQVLNDLSARINEFRATITHRPATTTTTQGAADRTIPTATEHAAADIARREARDARNARREQDINEILARIMPERRVGQSYLPFTHPTALITNTVSEQRNTFIQQVRRTRLRQIHMSAHQARREEEMREDDEELRDLLQIPTIELSYEGTILFMEALGMEGFF